MMWSDICSTYGVFDKSLKKMSPNHASVTKFGITWQAFSILRVLQPLFLSKEYSVQLSSTCSILHENKSLTINRFQYIQVLSDECSAAMLKQLPEAFKDTETITELAGKSTKKVCTDRGRKKWCRLERWWHFGSYVVLVWGLLSGQAKIRRVVQGPYGNCSESVAMLAGWLVGCLAG